MNNIMIDIETLGTTIDTSVMTIGAIKFGLIDKKLHNYIKEIEEHNKFYRRITRESCKELNLQEDSDTLKWWDRQSDESKKEIFSSENRIGIKQALEEFIEWAEIDKFTCIWANGVCFDIVILENTMKKLHISIPWKYYNIYDARTIYNISGLQRKKNSHNALEDCFQQINDLKTCLN